MANIRTKHDSIVLLNRELKTPIKNIGRLKYELQIQGKRNTEAYELLQEYQIKLTNMHNEILDLVSYPQL